MKDKLIEKRKKIYEEAIYLIYMDHHDGGGCHYGLCSLLTIFFNITMEECQELNDQRPKNAPPHWFGSIFTREGLARRMRALERAIYECDKKLNSRK